jgi:hypothetical protein
VVGGWLLRVVPPVAGLRLTPREDPVEESRSRCVREILTGVAMRRKGITEPHYLHPGAIDRGPLISWTRLTAWAESVVWVWYDESPDSGGGKLPGRSQIG